MRDKSTLKQFKDVGKLTEWLYADKSHEITVKNAMGSDIVLSMTEDCELMARFPEVDRVWSYDAYVSMPVWFGIIEQLETQPPKAANARFTSRWEEIKFEHAAMTAINA